MKKIIIFGIIAAALVVPDFLFAAGGNAFSGLQESGQASKETVKGVLKSWQWITAFFPLVVATALAAWKWNDIRKKEEQAQESTKLGKTISIVGFFIGGVLLMFILYAIIGKVFIGWSPSETWTKFVSDIWAYMLG